MLSHTQSLGFTANRKIKELTKVPFPLILSEFLIGAYGLSVILAYSNPYYNQLSNIFGMLCFPIVVGSLLSCTYRTFSVGFLKPLLGIWLFWGLMAFSFFVKQIDLSYFLRFLQSFALLTICFWLVRTTGRAYYIGIGFCIAVLCLFLVLMLSGTLDTITQSRLAISVGDAEEGLNPNIYGIMLNSSILFGIYLYINRNSVFSNKFGKSILILLVIVSTIVSAYQIVFLLGSRQHVLWLFIMALSLTTILTDSKVDYGRLMLRVMLGSLLIGVLVILLKQS